MGAVIVLEDGTTIVPYNSNKTGAQMDRALDRGDSVGDISQLTTTNKSSIVEAVNEINSDSTKVLDILRYSTEKTKELFVNVGYVRTDGTIGTNTLWRHTEYIDVNDLYEAFVRANSSACSIAYYDSSKTFISGVSGTGDVPKKFSNHDIPIDAVYCVVSSNTNDTNAYIEIFNIKSYIREVQNDVEHIENYLVRKETALYKNAGYINTSGEVGVNTNYLHTDLLDINIVKDAYFKANSAVCSIAFYDGNEEFISDTRYNFSDSNAHLVSNIEHPDNAVYCVISTDKRDINYYVSIYRTGVEDEVTNARTDLEGVTHTSLKARCDSDRNKAKALNDEVSDVLRYSAVRYDNLFMETGYISTAGTINPNNTWKHTDYLDVNALYEAYVRANSSVASIAYYDASKNFISGVSGTGDIPKIVKNHNIPSGAVYCIVSSNVGDSGAYIRIFDTNFKIKDVGKNVDNILRYSTTKSNALFSNVGYIKTDGTIGTNTLWRHTEYLSVESIYEVYVSGNSNVCSIAFFDEDKEFITDTTYNYADNNMHKISDITIPANAIYCIISTKVADIDSYIQMYDIKYYIDEVKSDVQSIENYISKKSFDFFDIVGYIRPDGTIETNTLWRHTDYLEIRAIKEVYFKGNSSVCSIAFYDVDKEFITDATYNYSDDNMHFVRDISAPNNAVYCIISTNVSATDSYVFAYIIGTTSTEDNSEKYDEVLDGEITIDAKWINGNLYNNGTINTSIAYRALTDNIVIAERDLKIESKDGFQFTLGIYNENNSLLFYVNVTNSYIIPKNARYRICVRRIFENTSETADVNIFRKQVVVKYSDRYNLLDNVRPTTIGNASFSTVNGYMSVTIPASTDYSNGIFFPMELESGEMYCLSYHCCGVNRDTTISVDFALIGDSVSTDTVYDGEQRTVLPSREYKCSQFAIAREGCRGAILRIKSGNARTYQFGEIQVVKVDKNIEFSMPNNSQIDEVSRVNSDKAVKLATWNSKRIDNVLSTYKCRRPMVTIIDDDGNYQFYTMLYPLMLQYHVPMVTAYMADNNYRYPNMYMSKEQLADVIAAGGEVIGHTTGNLAAMDIAVAEDTVARCQRMFKANGIYTDLFVYPNGGNNEAVREMMAKYYSGAFTTFDPVRDNDNRTNYGCIANYRIKRVHCGGDAYDPIATTGRYANLDTSLMEYFEELIAEAKEKNSWLIMYTHTFQIADGQVPTDGKSQLERLEEIIQYCIQEGVDIVTASEGFEVFGNAWQAGDYLGEHNTDMTLHATQGSAMNKLGQYDFPAGNAIDWGNL